MDDDFPHVEIFSNIWRSNRIGTNFWYKFNITVVLSVLGKIAFRSFTFFLIIVISLENKNSFFNFCLLTGAVEPFWLCRGHETHLKSIIILFVYLLIKALLVKTKIYGNMRTSHPLESTAPVLQRFIMIK